MSEHALNMKDLMRAIDTRNFDWLSRQSDEAQKEFVPFVILRWAATIKDGAGSGYLLWMINLQSNNDLFAVSAKHPDLVYRLMASCGLGIVQDHRWLPGTPLRKAVQKNLAFNFIAERYPEISDVEVMLLLGQYTRDEFQQLLTECGIQSRDAKDVMKAYDSLAKG